jgi:signal peptidase complex subunit 1
MDFVGQKLAEDIYQVVIITFSIVAFIAGYAKRCAVPDLPARCALPPPPSLTPRAPCSSFRLMMKIFGAGVVTSLVLTVPPWPYLNRNPLNWLQKPEAAAREQGDALPAGGKGKRATEGGMRKRRVGQHGTAAGAASSHAHPPLRRK